MGTDKVVFAVDRAVDRKWHDRKWYDRKWRQSRDRNDTVRKYVLRMRNRKLCNIRPNGAFWPEVTKSRDRKRTCPEVTLTGSRFCACPAFSPCVFFLVVVPWLPKVTWPLRSSLWVYATGSCATSLWPKVTWTLQKCPWGVLYDVRVL